MSSFPPPTGRPVVVTPANTDAGASLRLMGSGTLSRQLVVRVTALTALVAVFLSALSLLAITKILTDQLDGQLTELASRPMRPARDDFPADRQDARQDGFLDYRALYLQRNGTYQGMNATVQLGNASTQLDPSVTEQLDAVPIGKATVQLGAGLGLYRVTVFNDGNGRRGVVGLPASLTIKPIVLLLAADGIFVLLAVLTAFGASRLVIQRSLAPLQRLATTAHTVSQLELDSGEVQMSVRLPQSDIDPRSEVGQVGQAFNHMLDNVEGALSARQLSEMKVRQFVADASHELRNPLASIRGYAELTRRERDDVPPTTAHALGRIESESARMSSLVEDLLLLARLDSGPNLALTPTRLNEIVANAVSDAQVAGPEHQWELSLPPHEVVAVGDPFRLLQVIANLLANARTHTPAGTLVRTSLATEGRFAVIQVADNGPGIPPAIRDKVFERFTRADASRVRSGNGQSTGLGLAIVAAVMGAHRGSASVDSDASGTTFTIRVPLAREV